MKPRIDAEFLFTAALGLFVLVLLVAAFDLPVLLRYAPFIAGGLTFACIVVLLAGRFHPRILSWTETALQDLWGDSSQSRRIEEMEEAPAPWRSVLRVTAYVLGFLAAVYLFGFFVVPPAFVALYLVLDAHVRPLRAIAVAVALCVPAVWALNALNVFLWTGVAPELVPGFIGGEVPPQF
jgi:hypothetical protein